MGQHILIQLFEIPLFILVFVFLFYLPGKFLIYKLKLKTEALEDIFISSSVGILFFTLLLYLLAWVNLEKISIFLYLLIDFWIIKQKRFFPEKLSTIEAKPLVVVFLLSLVFSTSMLVTGIFGDTFIYRRDDIWHLALINELKENFPPFNPGFADLPLKGYHFFYNFLIAKISSLSFVSPTSLHFHFFPIMIAFLWGIGVYGLLRKWSKKKEVGLWGVFLTMFGGSFAFTLLLKGHSGFSLDSAFGMWQPTSWLYNPPLAISMIFIILFIFVLYNYLETRNKNWLFIISLVVGLTAMFKVYGGIVLFAGFGLLFLRELLIKRNFTIIIHAFLIAFIFIGTYWLFVGNSGSLIFYPLWAPHSILQNFPWYGFEEKMYTYKKLSVIKGILEVESYGLIIYIFGNLGIRTIGLIGAFLFFVHEKRKNGFFLILLISICLVSLFVPLLFIQSIKVFEITQMTAYFLFISAIIGSFGFAYFFNLLKIKILQIAAFIIILIIALPSAYESFVGFSNVHLIGVKISDPYFESMNYLKSDKNYFSTVLEIPGPFYLHSVIKGHF
ncbi:MAG: hypothetical protein HYV38_01030 [Candidatus Levybacteria bacterium]|nr:hypothetical protein [Candidatus Levybacteria bacterium]